MSTRTLGKLQRMAGVARRHGYKAVIVGSRLMVVGRLTTFYIGTLS